MWRLTRVNVRVCRVLFCYCRFKEEKHPGVLHSAPCVCMSVLYLVIFPLLMSVKINVVMKNNSATTDLRMKEREIKGRDRTEESDDQMFLKILCHSVCVCFLSSLHH